MQKLSTKEKVLRIAKRGGFKPAFHCNTEFRGMWIPFCADRVARTLRAEGKLKSKRFVKNHQNYVCYEAV